MTMALIESIVNLVMANSVCRDGHVLSRENVLTALGSEDQRRKERSKMILKKQVIEECMRVGLRIENGHCRSKCNVSVN